MKGSHLRHDKNCLNCGAAVSDRFCSHCGQENTEIKEPVAHVVGHFFADITHFDSKLFNSLKYLLFKPGFLTLEYNAGRRQRYLHPVRMYVFISAVFFLVMFSHQGAEKETTPPDNPHVVNADRQHLADSLRVLGLSASRADSTIEKSIYTQLANHLDTVRVSKQEDESVYAGFDGSGNVVFKMRETKYSSIAQYEAVQHKLPDTARDGAISRYLAQKMIRLNLDRGTDGEVVVKHNIAHEIPKLMFLLLPIFALVIGMLYGLNNKKGYVYSQHAIFTLHFHSFVFVAFMILYLLGLSGINFKVFLIADGIITLGIFVYLVKALHTAYREKVLKSLYKAFIISTCYVLTLVFTMCILFVLTFMNL
jgi:hypothetical protein